MGLLNYKGYIWQNAVNELRYRYTGTALGFYWHIINPILEVLIYWVVFSGVFVGAFGGRALNNDYLFFLLTGLLPWVAFSEALILGSNSLIRNRVYLQRLAVPLEVYVFISNIASYLNQLILFGVLIVASVLLGQPLSWHYLLLPIIGGLFQGLSLGASLALAHLRVLVPDISEILRTLIRLWRWTLPIVYYGDLFPEKYQLLFRLNPPYIFIVSIRRVLIEHTLPSGIDWGQMALTVILAWGIGWLVSRKLRADVKDEL